MDKSESKQRIKVRLENGTLSELECALLFNDVNPEHALHLVYEDRIYKTKEIALKDDGIYLVPAPQEQEETLRGEAFMKMMEIRPASTSYLEDASARHLYLSKSCDGIKLKKIVMKELYVFDDCKMIFLSFD